MLFVKPNGQAVVSIKDAKTGEWFGLIEFFSEVWQANAITSQAFDQNGVPEISVLGVRDDGAEVEIQLRDPVTGDAVQWIELPLE